MINSTEIEQIQDSIAAQWPKLESCMAEMEKRIVGQKHLQQRLLMALLCDGHILLEGVPGLAKTMSIKTLADCMQARFSRIQFTPDLLPADVMGTMIYNLQANKFEVKLGPVFANLVLADEINRAPAKVQSALLEAMQERQVTVGDETHPLPRPFMVMATQNPLEQEGTYTLPEAQLDRFLMKVTVGYPTKQEEKQVLRMAATQSFPMVNQVITMEDVLALKQLTRTIYLDEKVEDYIVDLVQASRNPRENGLSRMAPYVSYGASPRATIALAQTSRAYALLRQRAYVTPDDVKAVAHDVMNHRVGISYEGQADDVSSSMVVDELLANVRVP